MPAKYFNTLHLYAAVSNRLAYGIFITSFIIFERKLFRRCCCYYYSPFIHSSVPRAYKNIKFELFSMLYAYS